MTNIKENSDCTGCCPTNVKRPITKLQKLYSPPRNLSMGNKLPAPFWENLFAWAIYCPPAKYSLKGLQTKYSVTEKHF